MAIVKLTAENFEKKGTSVGKSGTGRLLCRLVRTMSDDGTGSGRDFQ